MKILGLMSGTSLDGIDAAVVEVRPLGEGYALACERFTTVPFSAEMRARLLRTLPPHEPRVADVVAVDEAFGDALAAAAVPATAGIRVDLIASHGLTLYHRGEAQLTFQIGAPYRLRDALGASVVFDFRRADCALGGHGAPLVPHFDGMIFGADDTDVVALNLGGIANVSRIGRGTRTVAAAWDTGPANMLIDAFVEERTQARERYDVGGERAAAGRVDASTLRDMLASIDDYVAAPPPKSTGRERFGTQFFALHRTGLDALSLEDGCATLAAFTVATIVASLERFGPMRGRLIASGGGVRNRALFGGLREHLEPAGWEVASSSDYGVDPDAKEAMAFALFAYETLRGRASNVPAATGAREAAVLGAIVPYELAALFAKMDAELAANASA